MWDQVVDAVVLGSGAHPTRVVRLVLVAGLTTGTNARAGIWWKNVFVRGKNNEVDFRKRDRTGPKVARRGTCHILKP